MSMHRSVRRRRQRSRNTERVPQPPVLTQLRQPGTSLQKTIVFLPASGTTRIIWTIQPYNAPWPVSARRRSFDPELKHASPQLPGSSRAQEHPLTDWVLSLAAGFCFIEKHSRIQVQAARGVRSPVQIATNGDVVVAKRRLHFRQRGAAIHR